MSYLDALHNKQMKLRKVALEIGLESGLFVLCPVCHEVTEASNPSSLRPVTEDLVRELIQRHDPRGDLFDRDAVEIVQIIGEVSRSLPYRCKCHEP